MPLHTEASSSSNKSYLTTRLIFQLQLYQNRAKSFQVNFPASIHQNCHSLKFSVTRDNQNTSSNASNVGVQRTFLVGPVLNNEYKELKLIEKHEKK